MALLPVRDTTWTSDTRVTTLPTEFAVARQGEYAHLPRSAHTTTRGRLRVHTLCGQSLSDPILTDHPDGPICGTCHGRRLGIGGDGYAFRPRGIHSLPKRWCPGPRMGLWVALPGQRLSAGRCLFCGTFQAIRACGGPWRPDVKLVEHEHHGHGVGCPDHGWKQLRWHEPDPAHPTPDPRPWCGQGFGDNRCGRWGRPFWMLQDPWHDHIPGPADA